MDRRGHNKGGRRFEVILLRENGIPNFQGVVMGTSGELV